MEVEGFAELAVLGFDFLDEGGGGGVRGGGVEEGEFAGVDVE